MHTESAEPKHPYEKHVFVCLHERPNGEPRGSCAQKGSEALLKALKTEAKNRGLKDTVRVQKAGCLDNCEQGCSIVVYPEGVWYGHVTQADVGELVEDAAVRELKEETGITAAKPRLIGIYSDPGRDPRGHTVAAAYLMRVRTATPVAGDGAASAAVRPRCCDLPMFLHQPVNIFFAFDDENRLG